MCSMVGTAPTCLGLCVLLMPVSAMQPAKCRNCRAVSAGFRHFHKWKYKWWSIRDDFLNHFLESLTNSVTSSWITSGTFHNAKSSRYNNRILFNGTETIARRLFLMGRVPPTGSPTCSKVKASSRTLSLLDPLFFFIPTCALAREMVTCIWEMSSKKRLKIKFTKCLSHATPCKNSCVFMWDISPDKGVE